MISKSCRLFGQDHASKQKGQSKVAMQLCSGQNNRVSGKFCLHRTMFMARFPIQPHGRLQEWIAHEKGYFREEGLDYEFCPGLSSTSEKQVDPSGRLAEIRTGAFEAYE